MKKILWKLVKGIGLTLGGLLVLMVALPALFPGTVATQIKAWANESIEGELQFSKARLSFFRHFPVLTLTLHDFSLTGSAPFAKDTLLAGKALSFGLDLASVFGEKLEVNTFFIDEGLINVQVDEQGRANYNIYKGTAETETAADSSQTQLKIAGIFFNHCHLRYHDRSIPMRIEAANFSYEGRGDLANDQFDLESILRAESFDFVYQNTAYIQHRKLQAELITGINTASLVFRFSKNNLLINKLPVDFSGNLAILKEGYDIDLNVVSGVTDFGNIFSALPPEYDHWFTETEFRGQSQVLLAMKGSYRAATGQAPDLLVRLWVRDGSIRHKQFPKPLMVSLGGTVRMPGLNRDKSSFTLDSLRFGGGEYRAYAAGYFQGIGTSDAYIRGNFSGHLNLAQLDSSLGISMADLRGTVRFSGRVDGYYRIAQNPDRFRPDTVITLFPTYSMELILKDGYFKHRDLPLAIEEVSGKFYSSCEKGTIEGINANLENFEAKVGNGNIRCNWVSRGRKHISVDLLANLQLEELARIFPIKDYELGGALSLKLDGHGSLFPGKLKFMPGMETNTLILRNGRIQTPWYPNPIEKIGIISSFTRSSDYTLGIQIQPFTFVFEDRPFYIRAELQNPDNLRYNIQSKGTLDLEKIYQVFGIQGYALSGLLQADLALHGTEADALAGRYQLLNNKGTLKLQNLELRSDDYPSPFLIPQTTLRFEQEKAWLENAVIRYRNNEFTFNGYAQNFISHVLSGGPLQGKLSLSSPKVSVDDFMVFAAPAASSNTPAPASGVVLLPENMDLTLKASAKEVAYGTTKLQDFKGSLVLQKGKLRMEDTQAKIAGATLHLAGGYTPESLRKAGFNLTLKADSFDVKRAYDEIPLFREMASAAAKAQGLVSVDYQLQGRLNDKMEPVYPSIKGKGMLKLEQVKVRGLKLFSAISKATGKDSLNNPNLKAVVMRTSIANNIITIERTKMRVFGFRPRIEGQTSLDGKLNLRFRLGLPPLGIIGIPMTITGTADNPNVQIRKGKEADELEGEVDEDQ